MVCLLEAGRRRVGVGRVNVIFRAHVRALSCSYASFARSIGLEGIEVDKPEAIGPAWDRALSSDRPVLLDVHVDPDIPPIPPHADFEQIKDVAEAIIKGDPDSWGIVRKGLKTKTQELFGKK